MANLITEMQEIMCRSCTECEANWCDGEDKQECCWMEKIAEVGQAVEQEIRAKAIDEFSERLKDFIAKNVEDAESSDDLCCEIFKSEIDEIAEEMRGAE